MAATNRSTRITKLVAAVKKQFKPVAPVTERSLLENLLFACLLENSLHAPAESAFAKLRDQYFDWNEVRVSTRNELAEHLKELNDPYDSADRLKRTLQSVFEGVFSFDLEDLKKQNLGQTIKQFQSYKGVTSFVIAYATQNSLGGHSIPVNEGLFASFVTLDIITPAEAKAGTAPGLERAVPKSKGVEVGSILHQLGVEVGKNPYGQNARKLLLSLDPTCKERLPKRPPKADPPPKKKQKSIAKAADDAKAKAQSSSKPAASKSTSKKEASKKTPSAKPNAKAVPKKATASKSSAKAPKKKTVSSPAKKTVKKKIKKKIAKKEAPTTKKRKAAASSPGKKSAAKTKKTSKKRKPK